MARRDPHSYYDDAQPKISSFELALRVDFGRKMLTGNAKLVFESEAKGSLNLDSRDLEIRKVNLEDGTELKHRLHPKDPVLGSRFEIEFDSPSKSVVIEYDIPENASALQWLNPSQTRGKSQPFLFSQCQAIHARSLVPIQDSPAVRVTYTASITVPAELTAVMAAGSAGTSEDPEKGEKTFFFKMPQPIPPYLFAFAAGRIAAKEVGPRTRIWAEPEILDKAAYEFEETENMIKEAEALFGPYEWERFDLLVLPPSFPYGGMENPRLTFLTPTLIAGDRSLVAVVVHELAHSWTGNLVTNANAEHFWINEGFTVWAERRILEKLYGSEAAVMSYAQGFNSLKGALDRFGADSPFTCLVTKLEGVNPDDVFSEVPYEKGCLFLRLLEETVSRASWDRFIRAYIEKYRFTSIETTELRSFIETHFPGIMEKVGGDEWLFSPGIPGNCPQIQSQRLDFISNISAAFKHGTYPSTAEISAMNTSEKLVYLQGLGRPLSREECVWLETNFELKSVSNSEILCEWLTIAAASDYEPAFPKIKSFLSEVGRMKYLRPIYKAMANSERTRALASEIYAATKDSLHQLSANVIGQEIEKYGKG